MCEQNYPEIKSSIFNNSSEKATRGSIKKALPNRRHFLFGCLTALFVFLCFQPAIAQTNQSAKSSEWIGNYYFSEIARTAKRPNSQDVVPSASYEITIEEKNDKLTASFSANGVQLF
ncbi:MAG TPA: hypothetical protein VGB00_01900, partial [Pyrinomonadaceae bacterium]